MEINVIWHGERFTIELAAKPGADSFLAIKGCKIVQGEKGAFISGPAWKNDQGKWINHTYMGPKFQEAVIAKAKDAQPKEAPRKPSHDGAKALDTRGSGFDDMDSDVPF